MRLKSLFSILIVFVCLLAESPAAGAAEFKTPARHAILMDGATGAVLFEKNADQLMDPASMSKLMTLLMLFEALDEGRFMLLDEIDVSLNAYKKGGGASGSSTMFLEPNSTVPIEAVIRGIIVQSGNDASIALAEALAGSEADFAEEMTVKARQLGLEKSTFTNATGWPDPNHKMTARELAKLARIVIYQHKEYYKYFSEKEFTWNGIRQHNRNPLLYRDMGVDGLKTGHVEAAGYGLVASARRDGQRLILVATGLESKKQRAAESRRILEWGFRKFKRYTLFPEGQIIATAQIWGGDAKTAPLVAEGAIKVILQRSSRLDTQVYVSYKTPLQAPIKKGDQLAMLTITAPDSTTVEIPLYAARDVARGSIFRRALQSVIHLAISWRR